MASGSASDPRNAAAGLNRSSAAISASFLLCSKQSGVGPKHAVTGVFGGAEVDFERELPGTGQRHLDGHWLAIGAKVLLGKDLAAVDQHAAGRPAASAAAVVEPNGCL